MRRALKKRVSSEDESEESTRQRVSERIGTPAGLRLLDKLLGKSSSSSSKDGAGAKSSGTKDKKDKPEKGKKPMMGKKDDEKDDKPEMAEEEVAHVCPLCTSHLDEAIDEERILEHLNVVVGLVERLTQLQEGEEDVDSVIDETLAELLFQDLEEE